MKKKQNPLQTLLRIIKEILSLNRSILLQKTLKFFTVPVVNGAKKIKESNRIVFESRAEAVAAGRRPCRTCEP